MSEPTYDELMKFAVSFINYYDEYGIEDSLNKQTNKMETSAGVRELAASAKKLVPAKKSGSAAARDMRVLTDVEREKAIEASDNVVNLRADFSRKIAENGGTRGMIENLVDAYLAGDTSGFGKAIENMKKFTKAERGEENFGEK